MATELTADTVLELGGWDVRYARVLAIAVHQNAGLAIVDSNGDQANIDAEHYWYDRSSGWNVGSSSGPVSNGDIGVSASGDGGRLAADRDAYLDYARWACGRAARAGRQVVTVPEWENEITVDAGEGGWWAWIESARSLP